MSQQIALGGTMIVLPIFLQMVLEYNAMAGRPLDRAAVAEHVRGGAARGPAGRRRTGPRRSSALGFALVAVGIAVLIPIVPDADSGWYLLGPLLIVGSGLGLLVSQLNNYTLSPISEERVSEAAGVNSAAGSFGLSFGLAFAGAIMLATLSFVFTDMAQSSAVLSPAEQDHVAARARARRRGDEQHAARRACSRVSRRTCRPRSSASTPTPDRWRCRSRCSCRSSPRCSACSTRSG